MIGCMFFLNPARQYVIVEYNVTQKMTTQTGQIVLKISTIYGIELETRLLSKSQDEFLVNTSNYSLGIFLFSLQLSGKIISTKKVTITD